MQNCIFCGSADYSATFCFMREISYCECRSCHKSFEIVQDPATPVVIKRKNHEYYLRALITAIESCPDTTIGGKALAALDEANDFLDD
jgi:hypothetical protein